ncbi:MAG: phospholipid carrier-dependent glycosyltransferase [Actinobacteria bacterium]|nr:phospholipid carrier-dependent glycosyltransferase [Actinomycetota bacterium]NDG09108.1 phospholipid carrier-dependent glycosyltransferase [Actinomycetota bacterium]
MPRPSPRLILGLILLLTALIRFWNLGTPDKLVFDEVYYVDGAKDYLNNGVETTKGAAEFVVHPPVGKWLIALGIQILGDSPAGWRLSAAIFGTFSILLIYFVALRLFSSQFLALVSAGLMSIDGLHLVMSRTALLDIFLMFFLLAAFLALLHERHIVAALLLGLALGTKWSAIYFIAAILIYLLVINRRRALLYLPIIPITYLFTWSGWLISDKGWSRDYSSNPLISLFQYHREILNFHTGLTTEHSYEASPWNWLVLGRPTSFFYESPKSCGAESCSQEILAMGTPIIWWFGLIALFITLGYFITRRERGAGLILLALLSNYLPWLLFPERTTFYFYAIAFLPYLILAITYSIKLYLEDEAKQPKRIQNVYAALGLTALIFAYFAPVYLGIVLTYDDWYSRMWLPSWI